MGKAAWSLTIEQGKTKRFFSRKTSYKEQQADALALKAMKDVISCDKPRGGAKYPVIRGCLNGETHWKQFQYLEEELTWGSETSQYPEERKSNETPKVAASEMGRG